MLGRCVIDRRLRHDPLTAVYLARGREPGEVFSVWTAHSAVLTRSERAAHAFDLEMERIALLDHPGIPKIIAFNAADARPMVISARRPGSSLRDIIASGSDRSAKLTSKVLQGLAHILDVLHTQSPPVLHRGLAPERVFLDEEGEIHLDECGFLHALVTAGFVTDRTVLARGGPGYLLPEEVAFPPTPALDVFSLATLLFELLTGRLPFGEVSAAELSRALRAEHLPTVSLYRDDLTLRVDAVFERAFGVSRGDGSTTVQAFARDLLRALEPDASVRLTLPGSADALPDPADDLGPDLSVIEDPEPTFGDDDARDAPVATDVHRASAREELQLDSRQSVDIEAIDLSSSDLQPVASALFERDRRLGALLYDQPTQLSPRSRRATDPSVVAPSAALINHGAIPSPAHLPSDGVRPSSLPTPGLDAAQIFGHAARLLALSTVIAALCITAGLLYIARASDDLNATLRALPRDFPAMDAGLSHAPVLVASSDADSGPTIAGDLADPLASTGRSTPAPAVAPPGSMPGPSVVFRLMAALRGPVADCVEGVEARSVTIRPRFDGASGAVVHIRLRGNFHEAPMGPCLEQAVRRVRVAPFAAPHWEPSLTFPIAPPRWNP